MPRTPAQKMGIKEGARTWMVNTPTGVKEKMALPDLERPKSLEGELDYIHLFVESKRDLAEVVPHLKPHLARRGALWVSWPKGRQRGTDLTLHHVIQIVYQFGLAESKCLSIDDTWSALKFTWPKPGKTYKNNHGVLVRDDEPPLNTTTSCETVSTLT